MGVSVTPRARSISYCIERVATSFGLTFDDLVGPEQVQPVSSVRQIAMHVARRVTGHTYETLGRTFQRDHTTVMTGYRHTGDRVRKHPWMKRRVDRLVAQLSSELGLIPSHDPGGSVQSQLNGASSPALGEGSPS